MPRLSPYFESLARRPGLCPECGRPLRLEPLELTWDAASWRCACGWFQVVTAPEAAKLGPRGREVPRTGRIIDVEVARWRG